MSGNYWLDEIKTNVQNIEVDTDFLLESQRLYNETIKDELFQRISLDLVKNIYTKCISGKIASIQPQKWSADVGTINDDIEIKPDIFRYKVLWSALVDGLRVQSNNVDSELEFTSILSDELTMEIDRRTLTDIRNTASTRMDWDLLTAPGNTIEERFGSLLSKVIEGSQSIAAKVGHEANFMVTSSEIAAIFQTSKEFKPTNNEGFSSYLGISYLGTFNNLAFYKDPLFPTSWLTMGYRGKDLFDAGYVIAPFIPLIKREPEGHEYKYLETSQKRLLVENGGNYYANLKVSNFFS